MNWKKWKMGLLVALLNGVFQAMIGWAVDLTPKQLVALFIVNIGTVGLAYLAKHPADSISSSTTSSPDGSTKQVDVSIHKETPLDQIKP